MGEVPLRNEHGNAAYLRDVGTPKDANYIQTNVVRVNGRRQVYIPVFRQLGASTLQVVDTLQGALETMTARLTRPGINLQVVMDQSVYVRRSIESLVEEGVLGAVLCSLVILLFLGEWRMTAIAVMTIPISVLAAVGCLYATGNTINVMTLAGLALAIGPLVDSAIICLENTHRHLGLGATPEEAAYLGASEVALPELVSTLCTFLVLAPLAFMPGLGAFLFRPMAMAVAFAMIAAYVLSRTFVPSRSARWLRPHAAHLHGDERRGWGSRAFAAWEALIDRGIAAYVRGLDVVLRHRVFTIGLAVSLMISALVSIGPRLRREFFPEVDAGAFEIYARAPSGTRIEVTEKKIEQVEAYVKESLGHDLQLIISEIGVVADLSAAYTPNAGPMDAVVKVQLIHDREQSAQHWVRRLRAGLAADSRFADLEFAFDAGGMIRAAMNQGKSSPINVRVTGKDPVKARTIAEAARREIARIDGVVDARIIQRLDYPQYVIEVDRAKAADLGLTQSEVMKNVVAALNSSIQFHKKNFWIDPVSKNQYFVGVQYFEEDIDSVQTLLDVPITSVKQGEPIPLRNIATLRRGTVPTEITHNNLQATMDLTLGVDGRDLGHVAVDVARVLDGLGKAQPDGILAAIRPDRRWIPPRADEGRPDRVERRVCADARHVPEPGLRPGPGVGPHVLPDGGARQVLCRPSRGDADRAALPGGRGADAVLHRHGAQRPVAPGDHLHRGDQGLQHGPDDRLRPGIEAARGIDPDRGDSQGGVDPGAPGDDDGARGVLRDDPDGPGDGQGQRGERTARPGDPRRPARGRTGDVVRTTGPVFHDDQGPKRSGGPG